MRQDGLTDLPWRNVPCALAYFAIRQGVSINSSRAFSKSSSSFQENSLRFLKKPLNNFRINADKVFLLYKTISTFGENLILKMKNILLALILAFAFSSCQNDKINYPSILSATDNYLSFPIDEETKLPYSVQTFESEGKGYLSFTNRWKEILFYTLDKGELVKKVKFNTEGGSDNIHQICGYNVLDFHKIYVSNSIKQICHTDTTGHVYKRIQLDTKNCIPTMNPPLLMDNNIYLSQDINPGLGENYMGKSPLGIMVDTLNEKVTTTPLKYFPLYTNEDLVYSTHGSLNYFCFDEKKFVYSYDTSDSLYTLSKDFNKVERFWAKSQYIDKVIPSSDKDADFMKHLRTICESPSYGNIIYDKYRQVYYRFAYPRVEFDKEKDFLTILREGRKQFSIIVLDKDLKVIGETLFPPYIYNSNVTFVNEDGLYISVSHHKNPDFDENLLRFQRIELIKNEQQ